MSREQRTNETKTRIREATGSRQTGQFAYFAAQAPQRMWPQGTSAVDFSGSKHIGHSSRSGVPGAARKIESRVGTLGIELKPFKAALKDAVDSMIDHKIIAATA